MVIATEKVFVFVHLVIVLILQLVVVRVDLWGIVEQARFRFVANRVGSCWIVRSAGGIGFHLLCFGCLLVLDECFFVNLDFDLILSDSFAQQRLRRHPLAW